MFMCRYCCSLVTDAPREPVCRLVADVVPIAAGTKKAAEHVARATKEMSFIGTP
jgi:hypothetical protein